VAKNYERLRALLIDQETFPCEFTVKFVGKNTEAFQAGITRFESEHPTLTQTARRVSASTNHPARHISMTYVFSAKSADHIIAVLERVALIEDVILVL
jgi:putative lipoic acid-binding regulatory protein